MINVARLLAAVVLPCVFMAAANGEEGVPEPVDYRMDEYRAPVPDTLVGVTVLDTYSAYSLWHTGQLAFVDVMPHLPRPPNLPEGTIWRDKPRRTIPGSLWLPDVGYGRIATSTRDYFREGLAEATGGNLDMPVILFCLADCWMSWNAAKRIREEFGYTRVFWYPDGTDGWLEAGHELVLVEPWSDEAEGQR